jgi:N-acetylglucosamine kinase-like BadF-type ATPase
VIGRGVAGSSNIQSVGAETALRNLDAAIDQAVRDAQGRNALPSTADAPSGRPWAKLAAAVIALAGSDREENRRAVRDWASNRDLSFRLRIVHDALPVLAAGTPEGWGIALIAGTGSFAYGQDRSGRSVRAGGWGFLMGDEGSGYWIATHGLRVAAQSADGRVPPTRLVEAFCERFGVGQPLELIPAVYRIAADRAAIAALAAIVFETAKGGDSPSRAILDDAAEHLAAAVAAVARQLDLVRFPLALAGGVLLGSKTLQASVALRLGEQGLSPDPIETVPEPVAGAVLLAERESE